MDDRDKITPEAVLEAAQRKADRELREAVTIAAILPLLPAPPKSVYGKHTTSYGDVSVTYEVDTRAQALEIFRAFGDKVCTLARVKGVFLSYMPADTAERNARETDDVTTGIHNLNWEHSCWPSDGGGLHRESKIVFYAQVGAVRASVRVVIKLDPAHMQEAHVRTGGASHGRIIRKEWRSTSFPAGSRDQYASGSSDSPGNVIVRFASGDDLEAALLART